MATPNIVPRADSEGQLGTASKYWAAAYIDLIYLGAGKIGRDADNLLDFTTDNQIRFRVNGGDEANMTNGYFYPHTNDGLGLGFGGNAWSDLFLADGAVINFNNGEITLTQIDNKLVLADSDQFGIGNDGDLLMYHDSTDSYITNDTGDLYIQNTRDDKDIIFRSDDGSGGNAAYFFLDGSSASGGTLYTQFPDNSNLTFGSANDLEIKHDGTDSKITNSVGDLVIRNLADDKDIILQSDDGSGGVTAYLTLDGSAGYMTAQKSIKFEDSVTAYFGASNDLQIYHNGTDSHIRNTQDVGDLVIRNSADDKDLIFQCDDGNGSDATYFYLDGSSAAYSGGATTALYTNWPDLSRISLGTGHDLQLYHDGSNSYISDSGTGVLYIRSGGSTAITVNGTAVTFSGTINGIPFFSDVATNSMYTHDVSATDSTASFNTAYGFVAMDAITTGDNNTAVGYEAGSSLTTGEKNVAIGKAALSSEDTGSRNIAIGSGALQTLNYDGTGYNVAVGYDAGVNLTTGRDNVLVGGQAGDSLTTGGWNIAIGRLALAAEDEDGYNIAIGFGALTTQNAGAAAYNIAIGHNAGQAITTGIKNTIIGGNAGDALTTGNENVAIGYEALTAEDTGGKNVAVGKETLRALDVGGDGYNVAVGFEAGHDMTTGVKNTIIGGEAGDALTTGNNNIAMGYGALGSEDTGSRNVAIGQSALNSLNYDGNGYNVAIGHEAGVTVSTGLLNILIGGFAGDALTTGGDNVAIGYAALGAEDGHGKNIAIGTQALEDQNAGADGYNIAIGHQAGKDVTDGVNNVLIGGLAGDTLVSGERNVVMGHGALGAANGSESRNTAIGWSTLAVLDNDGNNSNTALGYAAGMAVTTGANNTLIGSQAGDAITTGDNNIIIGATAAASAVDVDNTTVIGTGSTTNAIIHGLRKTVVATATNIAAPRINNIHNFSDADGATVTLPDSGGGDYIGASFEFVCSIAATSNSHKIVCTDTTNELILGALTMVDTDTSDAIVGMAAEVDDSFSAVSFNGTTTGGRIGTKIKITNIAADKWFVEGTVLHSGSASTPFATS